MITRGDLLEQVIDRERSDANDYVFSHKIKKEAKATSQKSSGRCWMFAALNVLRLRVIKEHNLPSDFELSQCELW